MYFYLQKLYKIYNFIAVGYYKEASKMTKMLKPTSLIILVVFDMIFKKIHVFRIKPGSRLVESLKDYCEKNSINSAIFIGIIGSLKEIELAYLKELPGKYIKKTFHGPLELVSSQGTVARVVSSSKEAAGERWLHIHVVASDEKSTVSGHLSEAIIFTTAEVVLGEVSDQIERCHDEYTGLKELVK